MGQSPSQPAAKFSAEYPSPPHVPWAVLVLALLSAEALVLWLVPVPFRDYLFKAVAVAWPLYLCLWIRKIDQRSSSLYWAIASLATSLLFSWLLWIVVIYELREELLDHYNRREPVGLRLNWFLTLIFSFFYFQYELNKISQEKERPSEDLASDAETSVTA